MKSVKVIQAIQKFENMIAVMASELLLWISRITHGPNVSVTKFPPSLAYLYT